jgi:hypothetical protein
MTSICRGKCSAEFEAFDFLRGMAHDSQLFRTETINSNTESMFFPDIEQQVGVPMNILAVRQLLDCSRVCESTTANSMNPDLCMAIAGILTDTDILAVRKYCIPAQNNAGTYLSDKVEI